MRLRFLHNTQEFSNSLNVLTALLPNLNIQSSTFFSTLPINHSHYQSQCLLNFKTIFNQHNTNSTLGFKYTDLRIHFTFEFPFTQYQYLFNVFLYFLNLDLQFPQ